MGSVEDHGNKDIKNLKSLLMEEDREIGGISSIIYKKMLKMSLGW